jgi:N-acetylmuramoyl-L-alanine amidase
MIKYKRIGIFVGHSKLKNGSCTSASGVKNEYLYNKELATQIKAHFDTIKQPCDVIICPEGQLTSAKKESGYKLPIANSGKYDLIIELHLNASDNKDANGAEVLYYSNKGKIVAQRVQNKLKTIFKDRKIKYRDNLYMLTKTSPVSIMLETFFCTSEQDCFIADEKGTKEIAKLIVEGILNTEIENEVSSSFSSSYSNSSFYEVTADVLNVRKGRGTNFAKVGTLKKGDKVDIWSIGKDLKGMEWGSFRYSFTPDIIGYVSMDYLKKM